MGGIETEETLAGGGGGGGGGGIETETLDEGGIETDGRR